MELRPVLEMLEADDNAIGRSTIPSLEQPYKSIFSAFQCIWNGKYKDVHPLLEVPTVDPQAQCWKVMVRTYLNYHMGNTEDMERDLEEYKDILAQDFEDRDLLSAKYWHLRGCLTAIKGNFALAAEHYQRAVRISSEIGYRMGEADALNNIAVELNEQGRLAEACKMQLKASELYRKAGSIIGESMSLANLASYMMHRGELEKAQAYIEQAIRNYEIIKAPGSYVGSAFTTYGGILFAMGEEELAEKQLEIAYNLSKRYGLSRKNWTAWFICSR